MRKRQAGQAFILALILLALGSLLVVPALRLTDTSLKSGRIITRQARLLYAADAAQEYVMWKLLYDTGWRTDYLGEDGATAVVPIDLCGTSVIATVVMRAVPGKGGVTLATDDAIKPTKTVEPSANLTWDFRTYTYTIRLEQLSSNTSQGLDAIYDLPPDGFGSTAYQNNSSELSLDGGASWLPVPNPEWNASKGYLKWPLDYNKDTGSGGFSSDPNDTAHYFQGIRNFEARQVKLLRFRMYGRLGNNDTHWNWVVLKPWNTLSGPQSPISIGTGGSGEYDESALEVSKSSAPPIIMPGVLTEVIYTISIKNLYTQTRNIQEITDYLPPGFDADNPAPSANITDENGTITPFTILDPLKSMETINGVQRWQLRWTTTEFSGNSTISMKSGDTLTLTFKAMASKDVSGSYYNEVIVILTQTGLPPGFSDVGVLPGEYGSNYSWNSGAVIVPAYDSSADAEGVVIDANLALKGIDSISITSYQVR